MALIQCPECQKEVSDKAAACIHCGFPIAQAKENKVSPEIANDHREQGQNKSMQTATGSSLQYGYAPPLPDSSTPDDERSRALRAWKAEANTTNPVSHSSHPSPTSRIEGAAVLVVTAKSRVLYIVLTLFFGNIGFNNFYSRHYQRGFAKIGWLLLSFIAAMVGAPGLCIFGFLILSIFTLLEIFIVSEDADGIAMR